MLKYWRIWLLVIIVLGAVFAIGLKSYPYGRQGVEIAYVVPNSTAAKSLAQGMIITYLNGEPVKDLEDWNQKIGGVTGSVKITANGEPFRFNSTKDLAINVRDMERLNLDFGLDIRGGTRIILRPSRNITPEEMEQVMATLKTRANLYGLKEILFKSIRDFEGGYLIQIEAAGLERGVVDDLLSRKGNFMARVSKPCAIEGNKSIMQLGEDRFPMEVLPDDSISLNGSVIGPNGTFTLKDIDFIYLNRTGDDLLFLGTVYRGADIELVHSDPQRSGIIPAGGGYRFYFVVLISQDGARRFADVTSGIPQRMDLVSGDYYLKDSEIILYLDEDPVSRLRISANLGGIPYTTPQVEGWREKEEDAVKEKLELQTILRAGAIPASLETVSIDTISPTLGSGFIQSTVQAALLAGIAVFVIVLIRYRNIKIALPMLFTAFSEVLIILGIAAVNDSLVWGTVLLADIVFLSLVWWKKHEIDMSTWIGALLIPILGFMSWTIDLPAIGGIIAAMGTGVDHQIIIADETVSGGERKRIYTIREKIKHAFFIIFGAASTTILAMLPLIVLVAEFVRGFAITTIIGVLVGVLITRPAYAKIIESTTKE